MEKNVIGENVFFQIAWSPICRFDKYRALGIPEMPGIICFLAEVSKSRLEYILFYTCWRNGLRKGIKDVTDPKYSRFPGLIEHIENNSLHYKYTVVDTSIDDVADIMFWLIKEYLPVYNNEVDFCDSQRYRNISLKELTMREGDVVERIKRIDV